MLRRAALMPQLLMLCLYAAAIYAAADADAAARFSATLCCHAMPPLYMPP